LQASHEGTLADTLSKAGKQAQPFGTSPSVGTWLSPRIKSARVESSTNKKAASSQECTTKKTVVQIETDTPLSPTTQRILSRTHSEMVQLQPEELIDAFKETLVAKDNEIAELKARLDASSKLKSNDAK